MWVLAVAAAWNMFPYCCNTGPTAVHGSESAQQADVFVSSSRAGCFWDDCPSFCPFIWAASVIVPVCSLACLLLFSSPPEQSTTSWNTGQSWIKVIWSLRAMTPVSVRPLQQPAPPHPKSLWSWSSHTSGDRIGVLWEGRVRVESCLPRSLSERLC